MNIYDIAKKAGVSIATVSRVLNGLDTVKESTKEKVLAVIEQENYRPNAFARGLSTDSMRLVGIMCTDVSDAFFAKAVSILQTLLRERGFSALLCCTGDDLTDRKKQLGFLLEKHVDAVFLIGSAFCAETDNEYLFDAANSVPLFMINAKSEHENIYSAYCDEESAVANAVNSLCKAGKQNILYIYDRLTPSSVSKLSGYVRGITENGVKYNENLIIKVPKTIEGGKNAVKTAIKSGNIPDAVITAEDILGVGALKEMQKNKIKPCVIGFNNSFLCECTSPTLSSIDNKLEEMCNIAVNTMDSVFSGETPKNKYLINAELIRRESLKGVK